MKCEPRATSGIAGKKLGNFMWDPIYFPAIPEWRTHLTATCTKPQG